MDKDWFETLVPPECRRTQEDDFDDLRSYRPVAPHYHDLLFSFEECRRLCDRSEYIKAHRHYLAIARAIENQHQHPVDDYCDHMCQVFHAEILWSLGQSDKAEKILRAAIKTYQLSCDRPVSQSDLENAHLTLALFLSEQGRFDEALSLVTPHLLDLSGFGYLSAPIADGLEAHFVLAIILMSQRRMSDAYNQIMTLQEVTAARVLVCYSDLPSQLVPDIKRQLRFASIFVAKAYCDAILDPRPSSYRIRDLDECFQSIERHPDFHGSLDAYLAMRELRAFVLLVQEQNAEAKQDFTYIYEALSQPDCLPPEHPRLLELETLITDGSSIIKRKIALCQRNNQLTP